MSLIVRAPPSALAMLAASAASSPRRRGAAPEAAAGEQRVDAHLVRRQAEHRRHRLLVDDRGLGGRPDLAPIRAAAGPRSRAAPWERARDTGTRRRPRAPGPRPPAPPPGHPAGAPALPAARRALGRRRRAPRSPALSAAVSSHSMRRALRPLMAAQAPRATTATPDGTGTTSVTPLHPSRRRGIERLHGARRIAAGARSRR